MGEWTSERVGMSMSCLRLLWSWKIKEHNKQSACYDFFILIFLSLCISKIGSVTPSLQSTGFSFIYHMSYNDPMNFMHWPIHHYMNQSLLLPFTIVHDATRYATLRASWQWLFFYFNTVVVVFARRQRYLWHFERGVGTGSWKQMIRSTRCADSLNLIVR